MLAVKNRLIFGIIKRFITGVLKVINGVLSLFNLQAAALAGLVGLILYLTGVFERNAAVFLVYCLVLIGAVVFAVVKTVMNLLGISGKNKKRKGVEIMDVGDEAVHAPQKEQTNTFKSQAGEYAPQAHTAANAFENSAVREVFGEEVSAETPAKSRVYPLYFSVKQNKDYIMAEYADRYELYFKDAYGLKKIRTDYKNGENL